jgi:hypothetical protein
MFRIFPAAFLFAVLLAALAVLVGAVAPGAALAESDAAKGLRKDHGLVPFAPPPSFLNGTFTGAEMNPAYLFGPVRAYETSRSCPTTWLIEAEEKARLDARAGKAEADKPFEYTLFLEEDCTPGVVYSVFVATEAVTPQQWMAWRHQFHKNKAEGEYGETVKQLDQAVKDGMAPTGELRYIERGGVLCQGCPEDELLKDPRIKPVYDLRQGRRLDAKAAQ